MDARRNICEAGRRHAAAVETRFRTMTTTELIARILSPNTLPLHVSIMQAIVQERQQQEAGNEKRNKL